jgi:DNA-binding Lrp family transcriptional regulator
VSGSSSGAPAFARRSTTPSRGEGLTGPRRLPMSKSGSKKMRAYVLIETAPGKTKAVKKELVAIGGADSTVVNLDAVTGPFDFIAVVEGPTLDAVGRLVTDEIGSIDGVTRTTTCLAVAIG